MSLKINDLTWEQFRDRVPSTCDLAIVPVGTIEAHGGMLEAASAPGQGSVFTALLPRAT